MKITEVREFSTDELMVKLRDLKEELFNLRFQNATKQLDNPIKIALAKKDIAKIKTVIKERELGINAISV